ncbi:MAG: hypothetical protein HYZ10_15890 [Ignavibacteriales bacterium]|nr:hypothetical protein [Ignavibacteriales bacterium]
MVFVLSIVTFSQTRKDTSASQTPSEKPTQIPPSIEKRFDPKSTVHLFQKDFVIPLDLKKYTAIMSADILKQENFSKEELDSGLFDNEIISFRDNKSSTMRVLSEFYGEDLINVQKLLDELGLTKDQIVGFLMMLKFAFGQSLLK